MKSHSKKRCIFLVIALMLALLLAAACSSNNENDDNDSNDPPQQQENQPPPELPTQQDETTPDPGNEQSPAIFGVHAPRDLGGRTLRIQSWFGGAISYTEGLWAEEPDPATSPNYLAYRMRWDNFHRVLDEFNFTLEEILIGDDYMAHLTASVLSGAPIAEVVRTGGNHAAIGLLGDLIIPLNNIDLPGSDLLGPRLFSQPMVEFRGDIWSMNDSRPDLFAFTMGVNLDIIRAIGAPNPVDLYNQGQWTWDAMLDIMRMASADTTGDGVIDRFGISGQPDNVLVNLIGSNDGMMVNDDLNFAFDHPNTIQAFEFFETIVQEGLFDHDPNVGLTADWGRNFWSFHGGNVAFFNAVVWGLDGVSFDFAILPWPTGPSNTSGSQGMAGWREGISFVAGADWDPADILTVVEEFYAWSGGDIHLMHEDALNWPRAVFPTEEDVQRTLRVAERSIRDLGLVVDGYHHVLNSFAINLFERNATVMELIETYRPPQQEMLDAFFR